MNKTSCFLAAVVLLGIAAETARAYDESVHHAVLQVLALNNGYSPQAAAMVADASQSLDDLDQLTAFSLPKLAAEAKDTFTNLPVGSYQNPVDSGAAKLKTAYEKGVGLDHMCTGQLFHALTEHREAIEQLHIDRINRALREAGDDPRKRNLAMLYLGEYLHFLSDAVVHPTNPLLGHAKEFDAPDRPEDDRGKLEVAMRLMKEKLNQFAAGEVRPTTWQADTRAKSTIPVPADTTSSLDAVELKLADTVVDKVLKVTFAQEVRKAFDERKLDVWHVFDEQRERQLAATLDDFVRANGKEFPSQTVHLEGERHAEQAAAVGFQTHRTIQLDGSGDPFDTDDNVAQFGKTRSIDNLGSFFAAAAIPQLQDERKRELATAGMLTFRDDKAAAAAGLPPADDSTNGRWALPSGPGGVALNPRLSLPGELGEVGQITLDERGVVVVAANGTYPVESLDPRCFATILRTVCGGEVPFITIGSERSDRPGHAKVTYAPSLRGTREGAALYRADIQFKAVFAHYPFGLGYHLNARDDALAGGYPGPGGESTRLWITSSDIGLKLDAGALRVDRHGMRIFGETTLMREVVRDDAIDAYARKLTDNWDAIAAQVPEFRAVQQMALATALAFWVREHRVAVDPIIWTIPEKGDCTPDYAPLVACLGPAQGVTGGVSLTPEDRASAQGRMFFRQIATLIDDLEQQNGAALGPRRLAVAIVAASALLVLLVTGGIVWAVQRYCFKGDRQPGFWKTLRAWLGVLAIQASLAMMATPFLTGLSLSRFDKDFLAFAVTIIASPMIFIAMMKRSRMEGGKRALTPGTFALSLLVPAVTGVCGIAAAIVTAIACGTIPSSTLERVLTAELAPMDALQEAVLTAIGTQDGAVRLVPWTHSMLLGQAPQFEHRAVFAAEAAPETLDLKDDPTSTFPGGRLRRIAWPADMPVDTDYAHYSIDGQPPYPSGP
ncbi:MAG TPA: hypothetical protein VGI81_16180 [Tepidisphaeraceae bacterium]|jgi:hypothetical protein